MLISLKGGFVSKILIGIEQPPKGIFIVLGISITNGTEFIWTAYWLKEV